MVGFFTPMFFGQEKTVMQSIEEKIDDYFSVGGTKVYVLGRAENGQELAILSDNDSSLLANTAKVTSYITATYLSAAIPCAMLAIKGLFRSNHNFQLIDPKTELEKGVDIPEEIPSKIQRLWLTIRLHDKDNEIIWFSDPDKPNSYGYTRVFKFKSNPDLIFKIGRHCDNKITDERFNNMIKAKEVCIAHQLGLLVVPSAKKFTVNIQERDGSIKNYSVIAEKALDLSHSFSYEEETIAQLATFIAKTGLNDVTCRNIPLLNNDALYCGPKRIALIDLEHMHNAQNGFFGDEGFGSCGLLGSVASSQRDFVIKEAAKHGIRR